VLIAPIQESRGSVTERPERLSEGRPIPPVKQVAREPVIVLAKLAKLTDSNQGLPERLYRRSGKPLASLSMFEYFRDKNLLEELREVWSASLWEMPRSDSVYIVHVTRQPGFVAVRPSIKVVRCAPQVRKMIFSQKPSSMARHSKVTGSHPRM
jgi:hypothetical protein